MAFRLKLKGGGSFVVDEDVFEWAREFVWYPQGDGYPSRTVNGRATALHRELMDFPVWDVHHKNENRRDCRRENLEVLTPKAHAARHKPTKRTSRAAPTPIQAPRALANQTQAEPRGESGFKGVTWSKTQQGWVAKASTGGRLVSLGKHPTPEEAALAYDAFVLAYRPRGSYTNLVPSS